MLKEITKDAIRAWRTAREARNAAEEVMKYQSSIEYAACGELVKRKTFADMAECMIELTEEAERGR